MANRYKRPPKMWIYSPPRLPKPKIPDDLKAEFTEKAERLWQEWRPKYIKPPQQAVDGRVGTQARAEGRNGGAASWPKGER